MLYTVPNKPVQDPSADAGRSARDETESVSRAEVEELRGTRQV